MTTLTFRIRDRYPGHTPMALIAREVRAMGFELSNNVRAFGIARRRRDSTPPPRAA